MSLPFFLFFFDCETCAIRFTASVRVKCPPWHVTLVCRHLKCSLIAHFDPTGRGRIPMPNRPPPASSFPTLANFQTLEIPSPPLSPPPNFPSPPPPSPLLPPPPQSLPPSSRPPPYSLSPLSSSQPLCSCRRACTPQGHEPFFIIRISQDLFFFGRLLGSPQSSRSGLSTRFSRAPAENVPRGVPAWSLRTTEIPLLLIFPALVCNLDFFLFPWLGVSFL